MNVIARSIYTALFFFLLIFTAGPSMAGGPLTLEDAWRMALTGHEDVKIAAEGVLQARSTVGKATATMLPQVTAEGTYTQYNTKKKVSGFLLQPDNSTNFSLTVSQSLFSGGVEWNARKAAKLYFERTRKELEGAKESVMLRTAEAFFGVLKAERNVEIKRAAMKRAEERLRVARARFDVGEVTKATVLRAESDRAGSKAEVVSAENALRNARNLLKRIIGSDAPEVADPGIRPDTSSSVENYISTALSRRLDYRQAELDRKIAAINIKAVKGRFLPTLTLQGDYERREQDPTTSFLLKESISASLVLSYPIFEGGLRRAELHEARSVLRQEELKLRSLKKDIEVEVREAYNNMMEKMAVLDSLKRRLAFAEENYRMVFEQFKAGVATTVEVIDADTELSTAQSLVSSASFDLQMAVVELRYTAGLLREDAPR